jgi:hypothetical protein
MSTETEYPHPYQVWLDQCLRRSEAESVSYLEFLERRTKLPRFIENVNRRCSWKGKICQSQIVN